MPRPDNPGFDAQEILKFGADFRQDIQPADILFYTPCVRYNPCIPLRMMLSAFKVMAA